MNVLFTAKLSQKHQNKLQEQFPQVQFFFFEHMDQALDLLDKAHIVVTYGEDLTEHLVLPLKQLKWVQVISAGLDKMPLSTLEKKEVWVTNVSGIHAIPMAEYTLGILIQLVRRFPVFYDLQKEKKWDRSVRVGEIYGKTIGILGTGAIGKEIARRAKAFGMRVLGLNRSGKEVSDVDQMFSRDQIEQLLKESDFVVVITPLTKETRGLIGEKELTAMKPSAYLINIARGEVVDESALIRGLKEKKIAGAVLDVFSEEPLPKSHPFWELENCFITPHVSGRSPYYMERALDIFIKNLDLFLRGNRELINLIPKGRGY
ncbi:D-2-hydroxyacid dehydrogenase [Microaerobacter geothermalis]|uniref:D-2-hydroxyacid dehydrogenase n=1 Tax=Microaerobacter geothermalis TaxID=674972 RepID=UPI001F3CAEB9|nr:D-2-hydroxyacid dehydrogenase [Microaerobacter geothermalis]MCF6095328.1 D-2-hydroxyacid dehydrogenase [Microaerobacter geothermalis]